jgi:hypothetical protein
MKTVQERLKRNQMMQCCRGLRMNTADEENENPLTRQRPAAVMMYVTESRCDTLEF